LVSCPRRQTGGGEVMRFEYSFEELPLRREGDLTAIPVNGTAEIEITDDDGWWIVSIDLDGWRGNKLTKFELPKSDPLFATICSELERCEDHIIDRAVELT
jgi:hypothetical protein